MMRSDQIGQLADALSKAQGAMRHAIKDSANPFFKSKYADLASVSDACRAELAAQGLSVVQLPTMREGKMVLEYLLLHKSGEFIGSELEMTPVKADPQGIGSAITYARRYTLAGIAGVATEDDDGNAASQKPKGAVTDADIPLAPRKTAPAQPEIFVEKVKAEVIAKAKPKDEPYDGCIDKGRQIALARAWKEACPKDMKDAEIELLRHDWLKRTGFVAPDGTPTSAMIPTALFEDYKKKAVFFAKSLDVNAHGVAIDDSDVPF